MNKPTQTVNHPDLTGRKFFARGYACKWTVLRYHRGGAWVCEEPDHHTTCNFYTDEIERGTVRDGELHFRDPEAWKGVQCGPCSSCGVRHILRAGLCWTCEHEAPEFNQTLGVTYEEADAAQDQPATAPENLAPAIMAALSNLGQ